MIVQAKSISRLALGTAQFGLPYGIANQTGQVGRSAVSDMLKLAGTHGINTLDTAISYGESETCLGEVMPKGFKLVTKLPAVPDGVEDMEGWVREQIAASLCRLGVNSLYGLLLHRPNQLLGMAGKELFNALQDLKGSGVVQKIGVSIYAPSELDALVPRYQFDLIQAPLNIFDRRLSASGWLQRLKDGGVEVHTRSTFLQGLLLMQQKEIPAEFSPWADLLGKWHEWLEGHSVSAVQACLAYPFSFPEIERIVIGADSSSQLKQIIDASHVASQSDFPGLWCEDEALINPANWRRL